MKIKLVIIFAIAFSFIACENQENEFDDFGSTSVYFPFQRPVRTLIQGNYDLGFNENDNNGRFEIGVTMSGVYQNGVNRTVDFIVDPDLIDPTKLGVQSVNYFIPENVSVTPSIPEIVNPIQILPSSYYTIDQSPVTIPSGSTKGRIGVQLTDAFFEDPLSFGEFGVANYVIPLRITNYEGLDSLLTGVPSVDNPIKVRESDWSPAPKDYTLFGIKFINKLHGKYLRRGEDKVVGTSQTVVTWVKVFPPAGNSIGDFVSETPLINIDDSTVYREDNVVEDDVIDVITAGRNKVVVENDVNRPGLTSDDKIALELTFNDNNEIAITNADPNSSFNVTGTGRFVEDGDEFGGEKRDVIYLEYEYEDVGVSTTPVFAGFQVATSTVSLMHTVKDTLVIRNRNIRFEEFTIDFTETTPVP